MTRHGTLDTRFSEPTATATTWAETERLLGASEIYWITTVRADGRPHVTPAVGVWHGGAAWFCTGAGEQKAVNLGESGPICVSVGSSSWQQGTDVVVEGRAERARGRELLTAVAAAYRDKYGEEWSFQAGEEVFDPGEREAQVYRVEATKILAFAKSPHAQTTFRV